MIRLIRAFHRDIDVISLIFAQLSEFATDLLKMEASHHLIEVLRQHIHLFAVFIALGEQLNLCQHLVRERVAHHETGVTGGATQIHETALGKKNDLVATWQRDVIHLNTYKSNNCFCNKESNK